jgi:hypothetical protein
MSPIASTEAVESNKVITKKLDLDVLKLVYFWGEWTNAQLAKTLNSTSLDKNFITA